MNTATGQKHPQVYDFAPDKNCALTILYHRQSLRYRYAGLACFLGAALMGVVI